MNFFVYSEIYHIAPGYLKCCNYVIYIVHHSLGLQRKESPVNYGEREELSGSQAKREESPGCYGEEECLLLVRVW